MDEQTRIDELIKKKQAEAVLKAVELDQKISILRGKIEKLRDDRQAIERAPLVKADFLASMKQGLKEGRERWREFMGRQLELVQQGKWDFFTEASANLSLFSDRVRWRWLPLWITELDLEAIVNQLEELPGSLSSKEREVKIANINKAISEVEKEIERLL